MYRGDDFWVGYLSVSVAAALNPGIETVPTLKQALKDFLKARPAGDDLAALIRQTLKEKP